MIKTLWLIFSFIFFLLTFFHFYQATKTIPKPQNNAKIKSMNGVNLGIHEFINDFNNYIDMLNKDNRKINIATSVSYFIATVTALISYCQS